MTRFERRQTVGDRATILAVHGDLDVRHVGAFDDAVRELVPEPDHALIVSLAGCDFLDSVGVAALLAAFRRVEASGARPMVIVSSSGSAVRTRLRRAGLDELIPTFESVDDACATPTSVPPGDRPTEVFRSI